MEPFIRRARAGDGDAFVALMEAHKGTMYKVARSYLHSDADIADAMQETVLTCFEKLDTLREERYFKTWLIRILINKCSDLLREKKRWVPLELLPEEACDEPGQANVEFLSVLDGLNEKYRTVLLLYYGERFTVKEIAMALDMNVETVKTRLKRGRAELQSVYEADERRISYDRA